LKYIYFSFVDSNLIINFLSEIDPININISLFQNMRNDLTEFKLSLSQGLIERWKDPPIILPEKEMKEIITILQDLSKSKTNISKQLKGFVDQLKLNDELILAQNQEIKLLKKKIRNQSQTFNHQFT
jgi:hypothetical protein